MSELSRNIQALTADVATLRTEIDRLRAELRTVAEQFLDEYRSVLPRPRAEATTPQASAD